MEKSKVSLIKAFFTVKQGIYDEIDDATAQRQE